MDNVCERLCVCVCVGSSAPSLSLSRSAFNCQLIVNYLFVSFFSLKKNYSYVNFTETTRGVIRSKEGRKET